ncbi:MAG: adenosine deaminase [Actinobacteria bacterium]|nr:adenosine deaminase [Actinomycetota bacterium]
MRRDRLRVSGLATALALVLSVPVAIGLSHGAGAQPLAMPAVVAPDLLGHPLPPGRPAAARTQLLTEKQKRPAPALLVHVRPSMTLRARPDAGAPAIGTMPSSSKYYRVPIVAWVEEVSPNGRWGRVEIPYSWPRRDGWIVIAGLRRETTGVSVEVDLSAHRVTVTRFGRRLFTAPASTGASSSPTPPGRYFVTDRVPFAVGSSYGSFAFGISGIQPHLPPGWSGSSASSARSKGPGYHPCMRDLARLPKAELHIHLEGSIRPETVRELADRTGRRPPEALGPAGWSGFRDNLHFIEQYVAVCELLSDLDDFRRIGHDLCRDLQAQGVRYAEAVFSPAHHAGRLGDWFGPTEAVLDGFAAGERDFGVVARLAPDIVRDMGMEQAQGTVEVALKFLGGGVVAINCAGSERARPGIYADLVHRAVAAGLHSVPHAGEWAGPQNVWETLESLAPERIGHGVRSIEDPSLVERLAELQLPLEVCPTSNVATGVFNSMAEHPFNRLREAGVVVTLNSDDPGMFGSWVADEYRVAREEFGLSDEELAEVARAGVRASFADEALKTQVLAGIDAWLAS